MTQAERKFHRTNHEKRQAVLRALSDPQLRGLSCRDLAEHCGVSHGLVANIRAEIVKVGREVR